MASRRAGSSPSANDYGQLGALTAETSRWTTRKASDMDSVEKLTELLQELSAQRTRLEKRSNEIEQRIAACPPEGLAALATQIAAEAFQEVLETSVEFSHGIVEAVLEVVEDIGQGGDAEIGIEPEHYDVIAPPLKDHVEMLDAMLTQPGIDKVGKAALEKKRAATIAALELLENLVLLDDEEGDEGEGEEGGADDAPESGTKGQEEA